MKLYCFYNDAHKVLFDNWFKPSIKDDFEIKDKILTDDVIDITHKNNDFYKICIFKIVHILEAIEENINNNEIFLYFDVDIQFFGKIEDRIEELMKDNDILFQKGGRSINIGMIVCRSSEKTKQFWLNVKTELIKTKLNDENICRYLLGLDNKVDQHCNYYKRNNKYSIKWNYLPEKEFVGGHIVSISTSEDIFKKIPKEILVHHASYTMGLENKIKQLTYVKVNL